MSDEFRKRHECPADRYWRTYVALFVNQDSYLVIMKKIGNKLEFPTLMSPEVPCYGERMSECFSERFAELSGTKYKLVFLYSTINEALQRTIGVPYCAIFECLSPIDPTTGHPVRPASEEYVWTRIEYVEDIVAKDFDEPYEFSALRALVRPEYQEMKYGALRPWEVPHWHVKATKRATAALAAVGYNVTNDFEQFIITCNAAILRVQTQKGRVYLKVSIGKEGPMTSVIASFAPHVARKPILFDEKEEWMFMNDYGEPLDKSVTGLSVDDYESLSVALAELHIESMTHIEELRACGAEQDSYESWIERVTEMLNDEDILRNLGEFKEFDTMDGLADVKIYYEAACEFFKYLFEPGRFPVCLVHGDIHIGNVMKTYDGKLILFDWGCARIDFPLSDVEALRDQIMDYSLREKVGMDSYYNVWQTHGSVSDLETLRVLEDIKDTFRVLLRLFEYSRERTLYPRLESDRLDGLRENLIEVEKLMRWIRIQELKRH